MGMAGKEDTMISNKIWLILAGFLSGIGSSIQVAQCEVLLAQYFKSKHLYLTHISHMIVGLGFLISPILISYLRLKFDLLHVVLIYQAILLQGVVINIAFKKPEYLKSRRIQYHYVMENAEEEEDIFSKSLTELKVKTKDVLKRIELKNDNKENQASPSTSYARRDVENDISRKDWVLFNNDEQKSERKSWERFEDESEEQKNTMKKNTTDNTESATNNDENLNSDVPVSIFNDTRVNMNTTYSFDEDNIENGPKSIPTVFAESEKAASFNIAVYFKILRMPTFYKSLLTNITTKYSVFLFYVLFPSYLYVQISHLRFKKSALLIGCLSIGTIIFSGFSYWLNVNKQKRPLVLFVLCWIGACGYFLIATFKHSEYIVMFGAMETVLSIASLQHIGGPLLGLTIRGESNTEYVALSILTGLSFCIFLLDISYTDCFFMMALLQVITGLLWVSNYFYKRLHIF
ncbi:hypothetical protein WA026_017609 [Henosepilachna vigintioctopunctata]